MRIRPQLTIEDVLRLHEGIEWTCPPGSEGRGVALEEVHQLYLNQAALLRRHRQLPNDRHLTRAKMLADMVFLDMRTEEKKSFRDLARGVTGRKEAGDAVVERLARDYAKFLREYPEFGRNATTGRVERRARKLQRNCAVRIDRLIRETPELVGKLSKGKLVRTLTYSDKT